MTFQQIFNELPETQASASGRVNLLGEHTDYNDGSILPTAIPQQTTVKVGFSDNRQHQFYSKTLQKRVSILDIHHTPSEFATYIFGCIEVLKQAGYILPSLNVYVELSVPIGAGLSSSVALEVATLRAIRQLLDLPIDDVEIAQLAQQAEMYYVGVQCGILEQMASSLADTQHTLFLDTRTLDRYVLPFPKNTTILVIDSGIPRTLATSWYNQRWAEC
jgi:galactokinase